MDVANAGIGERDLLLVGDPGAGKSSLLRWVRHLAGCERCQAEVAELRGLPELLEQAAPPVEVPPSLRERTFAAVERAAAQQRRRRRFPYLPSWLFEGPRTIKTVPAGTYVPTAVRPGCGGMPARWAIWGVAPPCPWRTGAACGLDARSTWAAS